MDWLAGQLVHEARHILDNIKFGLKNGPRNVDEVRRTERNAYRVEAIFGQAIGKSFWHHDVYGGPLQLTIANADVVAETTVKIWVTEARASWPKTNQKIIARNAKVAENNKKIVQWNQAHPEAKIPIQSMQKLLKIPAPYTPPKDYPIPPPLGH